MTGRTGGPALWRRTLLLLLAAAIVYLGAGFIRQAQVRQQQQVALQRIEDEISLAQLESAELEHYLEFARSPLAVEGWARQNGWARPDEVRVVVVGPPGEPQLPGGKKTGAEQGTGSPQEAWWSLFFGNP